MDQDLVVAELTPLFPILYSVIESAWQSCLNFFEAEEKPYDVFLGPSHFRWKAKDKLRSFQPITGDLKVEDLSNNGLSIVFHQYRIRIWKTSDGKLPESVNSSLKDAFLRQQLVFEFIDEPDAVSVNLVVLWSTDLALKLLPLILICPRRDDSGMVPIRDEWTYQIPHPAETLRTNEDKSRTKKVTFEPIEASGEEREKL